MAFTQFLWSASLICIAAAIGRDQQDVLATVSVGASGRVTDLPGVRQPGAEHIASRSASANDPLHEGVRRVEGKSERALGRAVSRVSTFAGLLRTDRYEIVSGYNCSSGNGGENINSAVTAPMTLQECKQSCAHDDECTCVNFAASTGRCSKQQYCHFENCVASSLVDSYVQHSNFKVKPRHRFDEGSNDIDASTSQASFERSGARDCTNATKLDLPITGLSVTSCLTRCLNKTGCTCVKYERYYRSECSLMAGCAFKYGSLYCERSDKYDMYALITPSPTLSPTPRPTQAPTKSPTKAPTKTPTPAPTTPLKIRIWIDFYYHREGGIGGACHEIGNEEYTMKEMNYQVQGENKIVQGCLACTNNGDCNEYGRKQQKEYTWGSAGSKTLTTFYRGWENDHGDRCTADSGFWINDDDCHHTKSCSATIQRDTNGSSNCHGSSHGMTVKWVFYH